MLKIIDGCVKLYYQSIEYIIFLFALKKIFFFSKKKQKKFEDKQQDEWEVKKII